MRQDTVRTANRRCQSQSTARPRPLAITKAGATDRCLKPRMSDIRATETTGAMIKTDGTINTLQAENRRRQAASLQRRQRSHLNPNADSYNPEITINDSRDRNVQPEISRQENFRESMLRRIRWTCVGGGATDVVLPEGTCIIRSLRRGKSHCTCINNRWKGERNCKYLLHKRK